MTDQLPWYDDINQLNQRIKTIDDLRALHQARREHALHCVNKIVVLGKLLFSTRHNATEVLDHTILPENAGIPIAMTWESYEQLLNDHRIDVSTCMRDHDTESLSNLSYDVPHGRVRCRICNQGWTLNNCTDAYMCLEDEKTLSSDIAGKTIADIGKMLQDECAEGVYSLIGEYGTDHMLVRKPGPPPLPGDELTDEEDEMEEAMWREEPPDYVIQEGEMISGLLFRFYHEACLHTVKKAEYDDEVEAMKEGLKQMLEHGGFEDVTVTRELFPQRLIEALRSLENHHHDDEDEWLEDAANEYPYFLAKTNLGDIGVACLGEHIPWIDLATTSLTISDLGDLPPDAPKEYADYPIVMFPPNEEYLLRFYIAMSKKKQN